MKDLKDCLIKENKQISLKNIKYSVISYETSNGEPLGFLFEDISEINDLYYEWGYKDNTVEKIIDKIKALKPGECFVRKESNSSFEIISHVNPLLADNIK